MAHDKRRLETGVLIYQLPEVLTEEAIEVLETNEVISRSSVIATETSKIAKGVEIYFDSVECFEKTVLFGRVMISATSYRIYPLVTDLTVLGARAHMRREELAERMRVLGPVLSVYEAGGSTSNYRVIINQPEIPKVVKAWPEKSKKIFKGGYKYPITFYCRFCTTDGHLRCKCDKGKGKKTEMKSKSSVQLSPKPKNLPEHCSPSCSSSSKHNEYSFQPKKTLLRNPKDANLSRTDSQKPIPSPKCVSNELSDCEKLTKKLYRRRFYIPKEVVPDLNKASLKRKLDSPIDVNGTKRKMSQQMEDQTQKRVHHDSSLQDHILESPEDFAQEKEKEASDEDFRQIVKYPGKEGTTHWVPMMDTISDVSRKISNSAKGITLAESRGLIGKEKKNGAKHKNDRNYTTKSISKTRIQPSCHPNSLLKGISLGEDFITIGKPNEVNHVKKNRIILEKISKSSNDKNTDQVSTKEKICRKIERFRKEQYGKKQQGKMARRTCDPKLQGTNSVPDHPYDTESNNKERDLYPLKNRKEPSRNNPSVTQENTVCEGKSSAIGVVISGTRETTKMRKKWTPQRRILTEGLRRYFHKRGHYEEP